MNTMQHIDINPRTHPIWSLPTFLKAQVLPSKNKDLTEDRTQIARRTTTENSVRGILLAEAAL